MNAAILKLLKEQSEVREALNAATAAGTPPDEDKQKRIVAIEGELRTAYDAALADADAAPAPEFRAALDAVEVRSYLAAATNNRPLVGLEAEVNKELGLTDNQIPYHALLSPEERAELRQDAATTITDAVKAKPRQAVIPRVFRRSDAAWLGVMMPTAPRGLPIYPVLTAGAAGSTQAPGGAQDAEAATFAATMIQPTRAAARYLIRAEDAAQFAGLEDTLRADLRAALGKLADDSVVSANATSPNPGSIISHATAATATPSAVSTLASFDEAFVDGIDGLHAYDRAGVRLLIGIETERLLGSKRHDETAMTYGAMLNAAGGERRATSRIGAPATVSSQTSIQSAYRIVPAELRAFMPVWEGLEVIRDPYTGAAKAEIAITMFMLFGFDVVRGSIQELRFKTA